MMSCCAAAVQMALVNVFGGLLLGISIGFVPIYLEFQLIRTNCTAFTGPDACSGAHSAQCVWNASSAASCQFEELCAPELAESACRERPLCVFDEVAHLCKHTAGLADWESGLFAAAMIIGGLLSSVFASSILPRLGRRKSFHLIGLLALAASLLMHISVAVNIFPLMVVGRVTVGCACGLLSVACPGYIQEFAPEERKKSFGVLLQVFCTVGHLLAAGLGWAMTPTDFSAPLEMSTRCQLFVLVSTLFSLPMFGLGMSCAEDHTDLRCEGAHVTSQHLAPIDRRAMKRPLVVAFLLSFCQQMTGINAIVNYAPKIAGAAGLDPLPGNFIVVLWTCVTATASIFCAARVSMRRLFLSGCLGAGLFCLLVGIGVYVDAASTLVKHVCTGIGVLGFILSFEMGMGSSFYVLSQSLFPRAFRPEGASFTMIVQFTFNIIMNFCYPVAVQGLSGGQGGDQNHGMGIVFMFFGAVGLFGWFVLRHCLHEYSDEETNMLLNSEHPCR